MFHLSPFIIFVEVIDAKIASLPSKTTTKIKSLPNPCSHYRRREFECARSDDKAASAPFPAVAWEPPCLLSSLLHLSTTSRTASACSGTYLLLSSHLIATSLLQRDVLPRVHLSRLGKQTQFRKCLSNQTLRRIFFACAYLFIQH